MIDDEIKKRLEKLLQEFSYETIKSCLITIDTLLKKSNSFEDFKNQMEATIYNLTEKN